MSDEVVHAGKFLAYVLRHNPAAADLALGEGGWVRIDALIAGATRRGHRLDVALLDRVLNLQGKQRFEIRDGLIRAGQGHSVPSTWALSRASRRQSCTTARSRGSRLKRLTAEFS